MKRYNYSTFAKIVKKFKNKRVLVVGDLLLDQYIWGEVSRISPEAPVPVVWVRKEDYMPGGASNVATNLAALGVKSIMLGVVGDDLRGQLLTQKLMELNISTDGVFVDGSRPTSLKERVIANHQQMLRIDREEVHVVPNSITEKMIRFIKSHIDDIDGIIIEDYGKGVVTPKLLKQIVPFARKKGKFVSVDPKEENFSYYKGVSVITPNNNEASGAVGYKLKGKDDVIKAGAKILKKLKLDNLLITLGEEGMMVFQKDKKPNHIPTIAQDVFDVSGAGDTVIALFTLAKVSGASSILAAHIANCAGGIVVGKVGAATVTEKELLLKLKVETGGK